MTMHIRNSTILRFKPAMKLLFQQLALLFFLALGGMACGSETEQVTSLTGMADTAQVCGEGQSLKAIIEAKELSKSDITLEVYKSEYRLKVLGNGECLKEFPIVLGANPVDDKRMQGDACTPEGQFKVRSKYPHNKWNKFIWIDYPTAESREKFKRRKASGEIPSNAKIGGEIGIHGVPEGADWAIAERQNWTLGCVSLTNADVDEIYPWLQEGTVVTIYH